MPYTATKLNIVVASSEVDPFTKTGGLADVSRSLSKALKRLGHQVTVITPLYPLIDRKKHKLKKIITEKKLVIDKTRTITYDVWRGYLMHDLPIYFIEESQYLTRYKKMYGTGKDNSRFLIFDLVVLDALKTLNLHADVIQCHDWHTGLIPYFLTHRYAKDPFFSNTASLFTIHNLIFQLGSNWWEIPIEKKDKGRGNLPFFSEREKIECINFAKRAIRNADMINTVSEQYAEEIMTKHFGQELHRILKNRKKRVLGIINGIDYFELNPSTDRGLVANYDFDSLYNKTKNKVWLQKQMGLTINPKIPLIGWTSRLAEQKGIELIMEIIDPLLRLDIQMIILGSGDKKYEKFFKKISKKNPKKLVARSPYMKNGVPSSEFNTEQETQVLAASDIFLLPSRYEPCGIGQLKSLRYGAVPVVHAVGGLADTITDYNPRTGKGNGFMFKMYDSRDMLIAIIRAIENHRHRDCWLSLVRRAMRQSFSWEIPARKYLQLFRRALKYKLTKNK